MILDPHLLPSPKPSKTPFSQYHPPVVGIGVFVGGDGVGGVLWAMMGVEMEGGGRVRERESEKVRT